MYRPTIKSNLWLGLMTIAFLGLYWWSESSLVTVKTRYYDAKIDAATTMRKALEVLQSYRLPSLNISEQTNISDPLVYTLLGEKDSPITTDEGRIDDKITVLNPNFAAAIVEMLIQTGAKSNDTIAVLLTGSMPGANLAVYSAAKALNLTPIVVTSVGSSWWGANSPDFTWLDMERILAQQGIFRFRSVAASLGGGDDEGGLRLSEVGKNMLSDAIERNEVIYIHEGNLTTNIKAREELFSRIMPLERYKAVVNIGGGIAAMGHRENGKLLPTGVHKRLPVLNYPGRGLLHTFAAANVAVVHIYEPSVVARKFDLPVAMLPIPKVGLGRLYEHQEYDLTVAAIAVVLMLIILVVVKYFDRQRYKWREEGVDPDTLV